MNVQTKKKRNHVTTDYKSMKFDAIGTIGVYVW